MSTKITIGADELILWLRKNKKAADVPNDTLGLKILDMIENDFCGKKIRSNEPAYWSNFMEDKNVDQFHLPKTSAQYKIDTNKIGQLYEQLSNW